MIAVVDFIGGLGLVGDVAGPGTADRESADARGAMARAWYGIGYCAI